MKEYITKYRDKTTYDLSCSEALIRAANEKYDLGLGETEFKMMAPFSGGLQERDICGVVTAASSVLGILYTTDVAHTSPVMQEAVKLYKMKFRETFHSQECHWLIETDRDANAGCDSLIVKGAMLLEEVIETINERYQK